MKMINIVARSVGKGPTDQFLYEMKLVYGVVQFSAKAGTTKFSLKQRSYTAADIDFILNSAEAANIEDLEITIKTLKS